MLRSLQMTCYILECRILQIIAFVVMRPRMSIRLTSPSIFSLLSHLNVIYIYTLCVYSNAEIALKKLPLYSIKVDPK